MKHLFIINPAAGKHDQTVRLSTAIRALCEARGMDFAIRVSKQAGDCTAITRAAAASGAEYRVYACGGDGTLNEVVCGAAGAANLAVTHFPCGSGNDFVKNFSDPRAFTELERLLDPVETTLDLIQVGNDYSLSICSIGIDARIGTSIQRYKHLPLIGGRGAYNLSTVVNLIQGVHRHYTVELDGQSVDGRFTLICVCNGRYYGGGYEPVPEARPNDGKLEVLLVKRFPGSRWRRSSASTSSAAMPKCRKFSRTIRPTGSASAATARRSSIWTARPATARTWRFASRTTSCASSTPAAWSCAEK